MKVPNSRVVPDFAGPIVSSRLQFARAMHREGRLLGQPLVPRLGAASVGAGTTVLANKLDDYGSRICFVGLC